MESKLKEFDALYENKLNPRCTIHCETCGKFYSNKMENLPGDDKPTFTLIVDDNWNPQDCVHYNDMEINEELYNTHIKILKENEFLDEDFE